MRSIFLALVTLSAVAQAEMPVLQGKAFVDLVSDAAEISINMPYPFSAKGDCRVELRSNQSYGFDQEFTELAKRIVVEEGFHAFDAMQAKVDGNSVSYKLNDGSVYMTIIKVRSVDGKPLKQTIRDAFTLNNTPPDPADVKVILIRDGCK